MFGRPKEATEAFISGEISHGLDVMGRVLESEHPDVSSTDAHGLYVWIFATVMHVIKTWGRASAIATSPATYNLGELTLTAPEGSWPLDELLSEIDQAMTVLKEHIPSLDYDGIKSAPAEYYRHLKGKPVAPVLTEEEFVRFGATMTLGTLQRLKNSGHIKL